MKSLIQAAALVAWTSVAQAAPVTYAFEGFTTVGGVFTPDHPLPTISPASFSITLPDVVTGEVIVSNADCQGFALICELRFTPGISLDLLEIKYFSASVGPYFNTIAFPANAFANLGHYSSRTTQFETDFLQHQSWFFDNLQQLTISTPSQPPGDGTVPEPSSVLLAMLGLASFTAARRLGRAPTTAGR